VVLPLVGIAEWNWIQGQTENAKDLDRNVNDPLNVNNASANGIVTVTGIVSERETKPTRDHQPTAPAIHRPIQVTEVVCKSVVSPAIEVRIRDMAVIRQDAVEMVDLEAVKTDYPTVRTKVLRNEWDYKML
jgi:hypothetical protein